MQVAAVAPAGVWAGCGHVASTSHSDLQKDDSHSTASKWSFCVLGQAGTWTETLRLMLRHRKLWAQATATWVWMVIQVKAQSISCFICITYGFVFSSVAVLQIFICTEFNGLPLKKTHLWPL